MSEQPDINALLFEDSARVDGGASAKANGGVSTCATVAAADRVELSVPELFDFAICLDYMARSSSECLYRLSETAVERLMLIGGKPRLIRISCPPATGRLTLDRLDGEPLTAEDQTELARYVSDWFDLELDLAPFYRLVGEDPLLAPLIERFHGLRIVGIPDLFEALCWAIVGQQVNLAFAYTLKQRLTETYGTALSWAGNRYLMFPTPERLAQVSQEELCSLQLTRNKARAIAEVAERITTGEISREGLLALDTEVARERLMKLRGIGPWTADYVGMRCLRHRTAFPVADVGLQNAVCHMAGLDRKPTVAELQELFAPWAGWEAYATFYLWRALY